jgi:hypothetical protein
LKTGNSVSIVNNQIIIGGVVDGNNYQVIINNLGQWNGSVWGWQTANSKTQANDYQTILNSAYNYVSDPAAETNESFSWTKNNVNVLADTGNNIIQTNSEARLMTGNAIAMANIFNLVGMTFVNSNNFLGFLNILGNWNGNLIFAYPDMSVEVTKVAEKSGVYRISYKNIGYDLAKNVVIEISLPDGLTVAGKNKFAWNAGDVGMGEGGFIEIKVDTAVIRNLRCQD